MNFACSQITGPNRATSFFSVLAVALMLATPTVAQSRSGARDFVQNLGDTVIKDLASRKISDSERVKRLRQLLTQSFDVPAVAKFVLGVYWRRTNDKQFNEFLKLYEIYIAHNYAGLFKKYRGETLDVLRVVPVNNDLTIVYGRINQVSGPAISMEMRIRKKTSEYKALDLKIEGISMPLTHRKQFSSVINQRRKGVQGLIEALRNATTRFEAETPSQ
ncbi:MAG: MlaC/ttg2D family ABC transporter substrate-binding protein [Alphaproteobacteria bacterium]|jgi:phospholipid transport system substrate-binding protein